MVLWAIREAASTVTLNPDPSNLPGGAVLQQLTNGLGGWALIMALVGLVIGGRGMGTGRPFAELPPVLQRTEDRPRVGGGRTVDRSGAGDRQLLLPRRAGGALTMLEAFPLCPGAVPVAGALCNAVSVRPATSAGNAPVPGSAPSSPRRHDGWHRRAVWLIAQVGGPCPARPPSTSSSWFTSARGGDGELGGGRRPAHGVLCCHPGHLPPESSTLFAHLSRAPSPCPCCSPVWP